jgi:SAM-dependent methyltransferase
MTSSTVPLAAGRQVFGDHPDRYSQARPDYPEELYARLAELCQFEGSRVFEVGPGTGIATRRLLDLKPSVLKAIEPDSRLADYLSNHVGADFPQLEVVVAGFEEAALSGCFDIAVAATAFHWLEQRPALSKVASLLRPGGWWAMWWNVFGDPDNPDEFQRATQHLFRELPNSLSWQQDGSRPFALDTNTRITQMQAAGLVDCDFQLMRWTLSMDTEHVRRLAATFSQVNYAEPQQQMRFLERLGEIVEREFGGRVERRFLTALYVGKKSNGSP